MMRANLRSGLLHPEPRSIEHARRRMEQLDHEIDGITRARRTKKLSPTEVDLRTERALLVTWIKTKELEAMMDDKGKKKKVHTWTVTRDDVQQPLDKHDMSVVIAALRVAADAYDADEKSFRQVEEDLKNGKPVMMFTSGEGGVNAAKRLADQFFRQAQDARRVLLKLEDGEDGDGTVTE